MSSRSLAVEMYSFKCPVSAAVDTYVAVFWQATNKSPLLKSASAGAEASNKYRSEAEADLTGI